jgi:hypothetical protein
MDNWNLNSLLPNGLDDLVSLDDNGCDNLKFDDLRYLNHFLNQLLNLINLRNFVGNGNDLFNEVLHRLDFLYDRLNRHNLLSDRWHFLYGFLDIRHNLLDLFDSLVDDDPLSQSLHFLNAHLFDANLHDLLDDLWYLNDLFYLLMHRHHLLNDAVDWHWNFDSDSCWFINFHDLLHFNSPSHDLLNFDLAWYLHSHLNYFFDWLLNDISLFNDLLEGYNLLDDLFDDLLDFMIDVLDDFNFDELLCNDGNLNQFLNFADLLNLDDAIYQLLNDLRDLYDLFDDSWHHYNLLNDFLHFNDLRHLDHLLNDLIDVDSHLLQAFNGAGNLHNLLNNDLNNLVLADVVVNGLLDLHHLGYLYDLVNKPLHLNNLGYFDPLDDHLRDDFGDFQNLLLNHRYLYTSIHDFLHLLDQGHNCIDDPLDLLDAIDIHNLLLNNLNLLHAYDIILNGHNFLDDLWHLYDPLNGLDDGDGLFDDTIDDLIDGLNMIDDLAGVSVFHNLDDLLNNLLDLDDLWHLHDLLDNLLDYGRHFNDPFNYSLHRYNLFLYDLDLFDLGHQVIRNPLHSYRHFLLDNPLYNGGDFMDLGNLDHSFDDLLNHTWHLHNLLDNFLDFNNLFDHIVDVSDDLNRNVHDLLDLLHLDNFNDLLDNLLDGNDLRNFNDPLNHLLHDLLHLHDLGHNPEYFKDIIDVDNTHNFLIDHSDNALVHLEHGTRSFLQFFQFFQQGLNQNSQVEFHSLRLLTRVSVDVFDLDNLWHIFDDLDNSVNLVDFDNVDNFLLEELEQAAINFITQLRILFEKLLHLDSQQMDQMLGSGILDGNLDSLLCESLDLQHTSNHSCVDPFAL